MYLVYWIAMVGVGARHGFTNDNIFGDGFHLFGRGFAEYEEAVERYGDSDAIIEAFSDQYGVEIDEEDPAESLNKLIEATPEDANITYDVQDEETLEVTAVPDTDKAALRAAVNEYLNTDYKQDVGAPDATAYGTWVPGIPVLVENALDALRAADWLKGLILEMSRRGRRAGFVPQMLKETMLAFLEACGYMARTPVC